MGNADELGYVPESDEPRQRGQRSVDESFVLAQRSLFDHCFHFQILTQALQFPAGQPKRTANDRTVMKLTNE